MNAKNVFLRGRCRERMDPEESRFHVEAPLSEREEYEQQMDALPDGDRELASEVSRFADLCRYFSENRMQVPPHISREVQQLRTFPVAARTNKLRELNLELMGYLHSVSEDCELRM